MTSALSRFKMLARKWLGMLFPPQTFHLNSHRPVALVKLYNLIRWREHLSRQEVNSDSPEFKYRRLAEARRMSEEEAAVLAELKDKGIAILGVKAEIADQVLDFYRDFFSQENIAVAGKGYKRSFVHPINARILGLMVDEAVVKCLEGYCGARLFLNKNMILNISRPDSDLSHSSFAQYWHLDTPGLVQAHILLNDITEQDSHMVYAQRSHRKTHHKFFSHWSDRYVASNYHIFHCIGAKGTIYLFDGSRGLHKMEPKVGSLRLTGEIHFSPGNSVDPQGGFSGGINHQVIEHLSSLQKDALKSFVS